jgi:hypothetical protein
VIVTSKGLDSNGKETGFVYLFDGATGALDRELVNPNPVPGAGFGYQVLILSNGNIVVTSGANASVYLFDGATLALISSFDAPFTYWTPPTITELTNGNFVICNPGWGANGSAVGAVTWASGTTGVSGTVSESNSLIGRWHESRVGSDGVIPLPGGNYVVVSPHWKSESNDMGAVTWGNGNGGTAGIVSEENSLVGGTGLDMVGYGGVRVLTNGNYVVSSPYWSSPTAFAAGAVTWGSAATGVRGLISPENSLTGSRAGDAATLTPSNVYPYTPNRTASQGVVALPNGNYVVINPLCDFPGTEDAGAMTLGDGLTGARGVISPANSLVGSHTGDGVSSGVIPLPDGDFLILSQYWNGGRGALTRVSGTTGLSGTIGPENSLTGSSPGDGYQAQLTVLPDGGYLSRFLSWRNEGANFAGAVTWGGPGARLTGVISPANSLVGSHEGDFVGEWPPVILPDGNFVIQSRRWNNYAGAATWGSKTAGVAGTVSAANSLVGSSPSDKIGDVVVLLPNGNYLVASDSWDNGDWVAAQATRSAGSRR